MALLPKADRISAEEREDNECDREPSLASAAASIAAGDGCGDGAHLGEKHTQQHTHRVMICQHRGNTSPVTHSSGRMVQEDDGTTWECVQSPHLPLHSSKLSKRWATCDSHPPEMS